MKDQPQWLRQGFSFLAGARSAYLGRARIMPFQIFVDESGGKGQGGHFAMAGIVSSLEGWLEFSKEWESFLAAPPAIPSFHMKEAAALNGPFYRWSEFERDEKLRGLAQIINRYARKAIHSVIDLEPHKDTWGMLPKPLDQPYFWAYHTLIFAVTLDLYEKGWREPLEFIFDEQVILGPRAKQWYPITREAFRLKEPSAHSIMPVDPIFRSDGDFLPLQAADMFAWCFKKNTDNPNDQVFGWLLDEMPNVVGSQFSCYYDRERLEAVEAESHQLAKNGLIPSEIWAAYHRVYEDD